MTDVCIGCGLCTGTLTSLETLSVKAKASAIYIVHSIPMSRVHLPKRQISISFEQSRRATLRRNVLIVPPVAEPLHVSRSWAVLPRVMSGSLAGGKSLEKQLLFCSSRRSEELTIHLRWPRGLTISVLCTKYAHATDETLPNAMAGFLSA